jgi:hypothetical protein
MCTRDGDEETGKSSASVILIHFRNDQVCKSCKLQRCLVALNMEI